MRRVDQTLLDKVKALLAAGDTQEEAAHSAGVSVRTVRNWKARGLLSDATPTTPQQRPQAEAKAKRGSEPSMWPNINAADLVQAGIRYGSTPSLLAMLSTAKHQDNNRLHRFLAAVIAGRKRWPKADIEWLGLIAGFPIVEEDTGLDAFGLLAHFAKEISPWLGKQARREWHRRARGLVDYAIVLAQTANGIGYTYGLPSESEKTPPWYHAWYLYISFVVQLLPDPDKPQYKAKDILKYIVFPSAELRAPSLFAALVIWTATAPKDFWPPLSAYTDWKKQVQQEEVHHE